MLFKSLTELYSRCGRWDMICFTGDLGFSGESAQYSQVDDLLGRLGGLLRNLDRSADPLLLAVPGNHDLKRPRRDTASRRAAYSSLKRMLSDLDERAAFFEDSMHPGRVMVNECFSGYSAWWQQHSARLPRYQAGLLPGDFSTVIERNGLRLGVIGLNTAFLHLDDQAESQLLLDVRQLHAACGGDGAKWTAECDLCLLLTHHPPVWLHPSAQLASEIVTPKRFAVHLFGHMHLAQSLQQHRSGDTETYRIQGHSLFGMEHYGDPAGPHRHHGYLAGELKVSGSERRAALTIWPRLAKGQPGGSRRLVADTDHFSLQDATTGTEPVLVPLHPDGPLMRSATGTPTRPASEAPFAAYDAEPMTPIPPGGPYIPKWYIPRPQEAEAKRYLETAGTPVVLFGPPLHGKRTLMHRLLDVAQQEAQRQGRVLRAVEIDFSNFDGESLATLDRLLHELAVRLVTTLNLTTTEAGMERLWKRPGSPINKMNLLLEQHALRELAPGAQLILAMDNAEQLIGRPYADDFFALLRGWSQRSSSHPWAQLRLILALSTRPMLTSQSHFHSPFANSIAEIRVEGFTSQHVAELIQRYGLPWTAADGEELMQWVGGHPYLVRQVLYMAATNRCASCAKIRELPELVSSLQRTISTQFRALPPELAHELDMLVGTPSYSIPGDKLELLRDGGILVAEGGQVRFRYPIYRSFFARNRSSSESRPGVRPVSS
jgi:hypothetical protein